MRSGRLLAEESPQVLLSMYGCQSLEEVFLKLSRKQGSNNDNSNDFNISNNISLVSSKPGVFYCFLPLRIYLYRFLSFFSQATLNWSNKKDAIYVTEESGVVGLNFHQSKEALHNYENSNGLGNGHLDVSTRWWRDDGKWVAGS